MLDVLESYWLYVIISFGLLIIFILVRKQLKSIEQRVKSIRLKILFLLINKVEPVELKKIQADLVRSIKEINEFLESCDKIVFEVRSENKSLKERIEELEKSRNALIQELSGSSDDLSLEFEVLQRYGELVQLLLEERMRLLGIIYEELAAIDLNAPSKIEYFTNQNYSLRKQLDEAQKQNSQLMKQLKSDEKNLESERQKDKQEISRLTNRLLEKEKSFEQIQQELSRSQNENLTLMKTIKDINEKIYQEKIDLESLKLANEQDKNEFKNLESELKKTKEDISVKDHQLKNQSESLIAIQKTLEEEQQRVLYLQKNVDRLSIETSQTTDQGIRSNSKNYRPSMFDRIPLDGLNTQMMSEIESELWSYMDYLDHIEYWRSHYSDDG